MLWSNIPSHDALFIVLGSRIHYGWFTSLNSSVFLLSSEIHHMYFEILCAHFTRNQVSTLAPFTPIQQPFVFFHNWLNRRKSLSIRVFRGRNSSFPHCAPSWCRRSPRRCLRCCVRVSHMAMDCCDMSNEFHSPLAQNGSINVVGCKYM